MALLVKSVNPTASRLPLLRCHAATSPNTCSIRMRASDERHRLSIAPRGARHAHQSDPSA
jgi:hypothetical protein